MENEVMEDESNIEFRGLHPETIKFLETTLGPLIEVNTKYIETNKQTLRQLITLMVNKYCRACRNYNCNDICRVYTLLNIAVKGIS